MLIRETSIFDLQPAAIRQMTIESIISGKV